MAPEELYGSMLSCFYSAVYRHLRIPTYKLESAQPYQRKVDPKHVDEIISNFNPLYLDEIIVSHRDGRFYVVDGQNRIAAMIKMNNDQHCTVLCKVYESLTYEDEAAMFYHLDAIKNKMKYHERVKAMSEAGDNPAVQDIKRILGEIGLRWQLSGNNCSRNFTVTASQALVDSYDAYGPVVFHHGMRLLAQTWAGDAKSLTAPFIKGMCLFCRAYAQHITGDSFVKKLSQAPPAEIKMLAQHETGVSRQDIRYAKVLLNKFNYNRQAENRLPDLLHDTYIKTRRKARQRGL